MNRLAKCYARGLREIKNEAKATEWYTKAAEAGDGLAMNVLAARYENGQGVAKDMTKAVDWYTKAAKAGNKKAIARLGECRAVPRL